MSRRTGSAWTTSPSELGFKMRIFKTCASPVRKTDPPNKSSPESETFCKPRRQARIEDFFLGRRNVIIQSTQLDCAFIHVINDVGCLRVVIARLTNRADVDEI